MSVDDKLEPTPFEAAPPPHEEPAPTRAGAPGWTLPALGALVVLALLVVFWLPQQVAPPETPPAAEPAASDAGATGSSPGAAAPKPAPAEASPWSEAQAAKLRKEAQDVLQALVRVRSERIASGVSDEFRAWAGFQLYIR